jgi:hypothetical protein
MSSPTPEQVAPATEIKEEDSIVADSGALDAVDGSVAAASSESGLTKKDFDVMSGILHRITNFRDEEYGFCPGMTCMVYKLMNSIVAEIFPKTFNELSTEEYYPTTSRLSRSQSH